MAYEYCMKQIPPVIVVKNREDEKQGAAIYLEEIVNHYAQKGWDFQRVDEVGVYRPAGCLAALFGSKGQRTVYYVITFRRVIPGKIC